MDIKFGGKRALVTGAGKGNVFLLFLLYDSLILCSMRPPFFEFARLCVCDFAFHKNAQKFK